MEKEKISIKIIKWLITSGIIIAGLSVLYSVSGGCSVSYVNVKNSEAVRVGTNQKTPLDGSDLNFDLNRKDSIKPEKESAVVNDSTN